LAIFCRAIAHGDKLPLFGDGSVCRDFTHVSDICAGLYAALSADDVLGEAINLGHHEPIPIREVIRALEEALGRPAQIDYQPAKPGEMPITNADLRKAARLLAYRPKVDFAAGLREYVAWFRTQQGDV
jgi:UDP-glucuronate 4-epimerase